MNPIFELRPHPTTPCPFVTSVTVVTEMRTTGFRCAYTVQGVIDRLNIAAPNPAPARVSGLWQHTCCEAFVKSAQTAAYKEFNFSPSGDWAAYRFDDYRSGMADVALAHPPRIVCDRTADRFVLAADVDFAAVSLDALALSVVLQDRDGRTYYWALRHADGKPDFHHPAAFVALTQ